MPNATVPAAYVEQIRDQAAKLVSLCDEALATTTEDPTAPRVFPGERPDDKLAYRRNRDPRGQLSDEGKAVLEMLLRNGLSDEEIAARMDISAWGVGQNRRRLGRSYRQQG